MVTVGRILFAAIVRWMPARIVFHVLPIVLVGTFTLTAALPDDTPWLGVAVFGLAGSGLLGTPSADDQPRPARPGHHVGSGRRRGDRVLPGRLRNRRIRCRPARRRAESACHRCTAGRGRCGRNGLAVLCGRRTSSLSAGVAPTACGPRTASRFGRLGTGTSNSRRAIDHHRVISLSIADGNDAACRSARWAPRCVPSPSAGGM